MRDTPVLRGLVIAVCCAAVLALLVFQLEEARQSAKLTIGFWIEAVDDHLEVQEVLPGQPAEGAGFEVGDVLVAIGDLEIRSITDYDRAAENFAPGEVIPYRVRRGSRELTLHVTPGVPFAWARFLVNALGVLLYLGLAVLAFSQRAEDLRAQLLAGFSLAVAVELALPLDQVGRPLLGVLAFCGYALLTGLQFGMELHLASVIPEPQQWLRRRRWVVGLYYSAGLGMGLALVLALAADWMGWTFVPWSSRQAEFFLLQVGLPVWAVSLVALLVHAASSWPFPAGRHQAGLVLVGVIPWALYVLTTLGLSIVGKELPQLVESLEPLVLIFYPVAIFIAIFRYQFLDVGLVVRRGLVYTTLSTALLLVFYAALGAGGALFSRLLEGAASPVWGVAGATLILGLLFAPLRRALERFIEQRFFPERTAMRKRLVQLAADLPALGSLGAMGESLVTNLRRIFTVRSAALLLAEQSGGLLATVAASSSDAERVSQSFLLSAQDPAIRSLGRERRPTAVRVLEKQPSPLGERLTRLGVTYAVPLLSGEQLVGLLLLGPKEGGEYQAEELDLLELLSRHVATVFENARLFESATQDSLTGLLRREAVLDLLKREIDRAVRYGRPLTIGMVDLDDFKRVNDRHGHLAGDLVLSRVARTLAETLRVTDLLGRYGGEEFLILLPETALDGALRVADKLRAAVESLEIELQEGGTVRITASVGLAAVRKGSSDTPEALIAVADRWLYQAKAAGKNRVEPSTGQQPSETSAG